MKTTFEQWMKLVDAHLVKLCAMDSNELPDWCYRDAYEDATPARLAARRVIIAARDF